MKLFIALAILPVLAFGANPKFLLTAKNCSTLENQAQAVLSWSKKLDPQFKAEIQPCRCTSYNSCKMDFYPISPEMVKMYHNKKSKISGPNCWNRALVFAKILPSLSYSTPEEMTHWIDSPLCQLREEGDAPQPGDIIAIRGRRNSEIHGFTYLTDDLSFSKNGYHKSSAYAYQTLANVFRVYGVRKECWNVPYTPSSGSCAYKRGAFYNCQSLDNYLTQVDYEPTEFLLNTMTELARIDAQLEEQLFNTVYFSRTDFQEQYYNMIEMKGVIRDMLALDGLHYMEEFLWQALYYRADAIKQQLGIVSSQLSPSTMKFGGTYMPR